VESANKLTFSRVSESAQLQAMMQKKVMKPLIEFDILDHEILDGKDYVVSSIFDIQPHRDNLADTPLPKHLLNYRCKLRNLS